MWKYLNKGISTPLAIAIILILAMTVGVITWWQYGEIKKEENLKQEVKISKNEEIKNSTATEEEKNIEFEQKELEIVINFCREKGYYESDFLPPEEYLSPKAFLLNFIDDEDKEIIGLCWRVGGPLREGLLFVLKNKNDKWQSIWEKEGVVSQCCEEFLNLEIVDIDKDGIDEILYEEAGSGGDRAETYLHLYSPKYNEWFYKHYSWKGIGTEEIKKEEIKFSSNLDLERYKTFKEFLLK